MRPRTVIETNDHRRQTLFFRYREDKLKLVQGVPIGGSLDRVDVIDRDGKASLR